MFFIKNNKKHYLKNSFYDIIIPVPISKKRLKLRGYNQSLLIVRELSKILNIKFSNSILGKKKNNIAQSTLDKSR